MFAQTFEKKFKYSIISSGGMYRCGRNGLYYIYSCSITKNSNQIDETIFGGLKESGTS